MLARILPRLPLGGDTLVGPGDDCAVIAIGSGRAVITSDMMVHGPDFRLAWSTPHDLGWKAAATNLSDVAAMGARPTGLTVAIAAPTDLSASVLEGIADGLNDACHALAPGCGVVGGDLSVSTRLTLAITAVGDLDGREPVLRGGARPGDVIAVAGPLGDAGRGLALLFAEGVDATGEPDAAAAAALRAREPGVLAAQLAPAPPIMSGVDAARAGARAMIDLSDGLAIDARRVAAASGVAIDLDSTALGDDPIIALEGGEDHSLFAAFPPDTELPAPFRRIGVARAGAGLLLDGAPWQRPSGWDPYRGWSGAGG